MAPLEAQTQDRILDAARGLVLTGGAPAATPAAIALASGTPVASLSELGSRDELLARMWIRAAQRSQAAVIEAMSAHAEPREAAVAAGLAVFDFVLSNPDDARLLVSLGREDLFGVPSTPDLREELERLNDPVIDGLREMAKRMTGTAGRAVVDSLAMAVIDLPHGAVRRHLSEDGQPPPARLRRGLEVAIRGAIDTIERTKYESRNGRASLRIV